jgi:hypothetical protein
MEHAHAQMDSETRHINGIAALEGWCISADPFAIPASIVLAYCIRRRSCSRTRRCLPTQASQIRIEASKTIAM